MDVTSIGNSSAITGTAAAPTSPADVGTLLPEATQTSVSPEGGLLGELASLAQSDPTRFRTATAEIAQKLKDEASRSTGDRAQLLAKLADRFGQASQSGDPSALKPPELPQGHHGHGHAHHQKHVATQAATSAQPAGADPLSEILADALKDVNGAASSS